MISFTRISLLAVAAMSAVVSTTATAGSYGTPIAAPEREPGDECCADGYVCCGFECMPEELVAMGIACEGIAGCCPEPIDNCCEAGEYCCDGQCMTGEMLTAAGPDLLCGDMSCCDESLVDGGAEAPAPVSVPLISEDCCSEGTFCCGNECVDEALAPSVTCLAVVDGCCSAAVPTGSYGDVDVVDVGVPVLAPAEVETETVTSTRGFIETEVAEEPAEVVAEGPVEVDAAEPAEEPAEVVADEPAEEPAEDPAEVAVEEPVEEPTEVPEEREEPEPERDDPARERGFLEK